MPSDFPPTPDPAPAGAFLLATCQSGAEEALVSRLVAAVPGATRGAWRRGLVSFRLPPGADPTIDLERLRGRTVFARTLFRCFGQARWGDDAGRAAAIRALLGQSRFDVVHCFPRDLRGLAAADVAADEATAAARGALAEILPEARFGAAAEGEIVLDCVVDEADRWWLGWHRASAPATRVPGGFHPRALPGDKVSRAWLKLDEAIATFGIDFGGGSACEFGASPGGACQRLHEAGLGVVAVDPALVDPVVAALPRVTQWRKRARDVPLRDLAGFDWVLTDMNIDPTSTIEALARAVTAPGSRVRGIVATLKLPEWSRAAALDAWLDEFRGWGFEPEARQLSTGGREVCVFARRVGPGRRPPAAEKGAGRPGAEPGVRKPSRRPPRATRRPDR